MNRWDWSCWFQRMYWPILPVSDHLEEKKLISEDCPILSVFGHGHGPFESHISWFSHLLSAGCFLRQPTDSLRFMKECTHSLMDFWCTLRTQRIHAPKPHYCTKLGVWTYFCNEINWKCSAHKMHPDLDKCWTYWYVFALSYWIYSCYFMLLPENILVCNRDLRVHVRVLVIRKRMCTEFFFLFEKNGWRKRTIKGRRLLIDS